MKYSATIDKQYKDTIKYYSTLLPDLFEQNCLIVLTHYSKREKKKDHYDTIVRNVKAEKKKTSGICFDPILFAIDSDPDEDEEVEQSRKVRDAILSYILSLTEVHVTDFLIAKTEELQSEDGKKIEGSKRVTTKG